MTNPLPINCKESEFNLRCRECPRCHLRSAQRKWYQIRATGSTTSAQHYTTTAIDIGYIGLWRPEAISGNVMVISAMQMGYFCLIACMLLSQISINIYFMVLIVLKRNYESIQCNWDDKEPTQHKASDRAKAKIIGFVRCRIASQVFDDPSVASREFARASPGLKSSPHFVDCCVFSVYVYEVKKQLKTHNNRRSELKYSALGITSRGPRASLAVFRWSEKGRWRHGIDQKWAKKEVLMVSEIDGRCMDGHVSTGSPSRIRTRNEELERKLRNPSSSKMITSSPCPSAVKIMGCGRVCGCGRHCIAK